MPIFMRCLILIQDKIHFTSYCRYCFLHSGVMCDERCSANFILPEQLRAKPAVQSERGCPLRRRRDFCYFSQLGCSTRGASEAPGRAPLPLTALRACPARRTPSGTRPACYSSTERPLCTGWAVSGLRQPVSVAQRLCSVPPRARLRTLRSAIAWSHSDVFASQRARTSTRQRRDLLRGTSWPHRPGDTEQTSVPSDLVLSPSEKLAVVRLKGNKYTNTLKVTLCFLYKTSKTVQSPFKYHIPRAKSSLQ